MKTKRKVGKKSLKYDGSIHEMTELIKKGCKYIPDWKPKQEEIIVGIYKNECCDFQIICYDNALNDLIPVDETCKFKIIKVEGE